MWPRAPDDVRPALVAAARHGLPGVDQCPVELSSEEPESVVPAAALDGLTGFLSGAIGDGVVTTGDELAAEALVAWRRALVGTVRVEAHLVGVAALLDAAGVRWRLTKGAAIAHLDYPEQLSSRTFGDVDLIIHPDDWTTVLEALGAAGYRRPAPELRRGFDVRFGKGATLVGEDDLEVDLHLRFAIGRFGVRSRMEDLFARGDDLVVGGRDVPALDGPDRLLHACHHLALGGFSGLRVARDVAQLLLVSQVDWERTVATAERWGVEAVVARAVEASWERLGLEVDHPALAWARGCPIGRGDRRALEVFETERPFRDQALTAVPALQLRDLPSLLLAATTRARGRRRVDSSSVRVRWRIRSR